MIIQPAKRTEVVQEYYFSRKLKEIAAITDTSEDAVKKQLSRGRDKLKERLKL